jgi:hypothetical protein
MSKRLDEIEARLKAATPGPWTPCIAFTSDGYSTLLPTADPDVPVTVADMKLITHAPEDIVYLLERIRKLEARLLYFADSPRVELAQLAREALEEKE